VVLERLANAILQRCIHQQTHRHDHEERHDPRRLFAIERGRQTAGVFEEAKAAFRMPLAFVAFEACLRWPLGGVEFVGGQDETTVPINERLPSGSLRGQSPFDSVDHVVGWSALARSPSLAITWRGAEGALGQASGLHTWRKGHQRLPRIGVTSQGRAAPCLESFDRLVAVLEEVLGDGAFCLRLAGLSGEEAPAWLDPTIS
jgi:hypothetical protein